MLAVVVLLPIALMILACSLERFETLTTRVPAPRAPRGATSTTTAAPRLRLVPDIGTTVSADAAETATPAGDEDLRRAS